MSFGANKLKRIPIHVPHKIRKKLIAMANKIVNFAPSTICKKTDSPKRSDPKGGINDGGKCTFQVIRYCHCKVTEEVLGCYL